MKKNFKVIKISGLGGFILTILVVVWVLSSILILPVYGIKFLWNYFLNGYFDIQPIRLSQSALLWGAIIACVFGYLKSKIMFKFVNTPSFYDNNLNEMTHEKFLEKIKEEQKDEEKSNH